MTASTVDWYSICSTHHQGRTEARKIARRYIAIIGTTMTLATVTSVTIAQSAAGENHLQTKAYRILGDNEEGVWRLNETTGEVSICTA